MKRTLISFLLAFSLALPPDLFAQTKSLDQQLASRAVRAVALLYSQDEGGSMRMRCTATAYKEEDGGYKFVTASHCIGEDDRAHEKSADASNVPFYLTFDERGEKVFYPAEVRGVGYQ